VVIIHLEGLSALAGAATPSLLVAGLAAEGLVLEEGVAQEATPQRLRTQRAASAEQLLRAVGVVGQRGLAVGGEGLRRAQGLLAGSTAEAARVIVATPCSGHYSNQRNPNRWGCWRSIV